MANRMSLLALVAGVGLLLLTAGAALAGGCCQPPSPPPTCNCTPPPCCAPPTPPPPPSPPCCSPNIIVPGVNVVVAPSVAVNVNASATAISAAQAQGATFVSGGGGGSFISAPGPVSVIGGLNVEGDRTAYEATRTLFEKVVIQAFCFDDKQVPHPASQVFAERDVESAYEGELYRCIAGTHMQVTIAKWSEHVSFEGGQTISCQKGDALYITPDKGGGRLDCKPQKPARDCNERSLLRRFGAGVKVLTMLIVEKYTAYREETHTSAAAAMSLDGGVGGVVY